MYFTWGNTDVSAGAKFFLAVHFPWGIKTGQVFAVGTLGMLFINLYCFKHHQKEAFLSHCLFDYRFNAPLVLVICLPFLDLDPKPFHWTRLVSYFKIYYWSVHYKAIWWSWKVSLIILSNMELESLKASRISLSAFGRNTSTLFNLKFW